jgi:hypothetical protein
MAYSEKSWNVVIACHACQQKFEVSGVDHERIAWLPLLTPCPHCGAKSIRDSKSATHRVVELKPIKT